MKRRFFAIIALTLIALLSLSACKPNTGGDPSQSTDTAPTTVPTVAPTATAPTAQSPDDGITGSVTPDGKPVTLPTELNTGGEGFDVTLPAGYVDISNTQEEGTLDGGILAANMDGSRLLFISSTKAGALKAGDLSAQLDNFSDRLELAASNIQNPDVSTNTGINAGNFTLDRKCYFGDMMGMKFAVIGGVITDDKSSYYIEFTLMNVESAALAKEEFDDVAGSIKAK